MQNGKTGEGVGDDRSILALVRAVRNFKLLENAYLVHLKFSKNEKQIHW